MDLLKILIYFLLQVFQYRAGVESAGHYWFNLRDYLKYIVIETIMIKTDLVKYRRVLEEGQKGKNDTFRALN